MPALFAQSAELWPGDYIGITPDSKFVLPVNNIGFFSAKDSVIYGCLKVLSEGKRFNIKNAYEYDLAFAIDSAADGKIKIVRSRPSSAYKFLTESLESPDCSGSYDVATNV